MKLTIDMLRSADACDDQVEKFAELFGSEVEVTPEICAQHVSEFNWHWAAENLLSPEKLEEYERIIAPASEKFENLYLEVIAEQRKFHASMLKEMFRDDEKYETVVYGEDKYAVFAGPAFDEYVLAIAVAFGKLFSKGR